MDFNKYLFGSIAIGSIAGIQIVAWILGFDGQVTTMCTSTIVAIIAFVIGKKVSNST